MKILRIPKPDLNQIISIFNREIGRFVFFCFRAFFRWIVFRRIRN